MKLVLFDVDGTLTDTNSVDTACFVQALADVFSVSDVDTDWSAYPDATDSALVVHVVETQLGRPPRVSEIVRMRARFRSLLQAAFAQSTSTCQAIPGGPQLLKTLSGSGGCAVAIATGGWETTAQLKLSTAGHSIDELSMASADDARRRVDICSIAAERARIQQRLSAFDSAVYVGDGVWDARAAAQLGYRFVGVDSSGDGEILKKEGAAIVVPDFESIDLEKLIGLLL